MNTGLHGKTALITEAAANLGGPTALALAAEGVNLILASSQGRDLLEATAHEAAKLQVKATAGLWDISDEAQVQALVLRGLAEFGRIDVLVNNAGCPTPAASLEELDFELWKLKLDVEVTGTLLVCQEVLPGMMEQRWGRVISYTGPAAYGGADAPASAAQMGIIGLTRGIAREYGRYNITANCIAPAGIRSPEGPGDAPCPPGPIPRWGEPGEVAFLTVCLASDEAGYVTGQCFLANGGRYFL